MAAFADDLPPSARAAIYDGLTRVGQQLIDALYGGRDNFANAVGISPFEPFILTYDASLGDPVSLQSLATRMGLRIPPTSEPNVYVYWILERAIAATRHIPPDWPSLAEVIEMRRPEFEAAMRRIVGRFGRIDEGDYDVRLEFYMQFLQSGATVLGPLFRA